MWIKVCGMTTPEAVEAALAVGVDAIGFVFAAESKRNVTPERAVELAKRARGRVPCVAVTRHPEQAAVDEILAIFKPDIFQTDLEDFAALTLPAQLERLPVMRTVGGEPERLPRRFLYEGPTSGAGKTADWGAAQVLARCADLVLAGGLTPINVAAAIAEVQPFGVDVSSGVESSPGIKNPDQILSFVRAARAASRSPAEPLRAKEHAS